MAASVISIRPDGGSSWPRAKSLSKCRLERETELKRVDISGIRFAHPHDDSRSVEVERIAHGLPQNFRNARDVLLCKVQCARQVDTVGRDSVGRLITDAGETGL